MKLKRVLLILLLVLAVAAVLVGKHFTATGKPPAPADEVAAGLLPGPELFPSLENGRPTMADFGAGTCKVCKELQPTIDAAAERYRAKANIVYVDTGLYPAIAKQYRVSLIPTQIFFDSEGNEVSRNVGKITPEEIDRRLAELGAKL